MASAGHGRLLALVLLSAAVAACTSHGSGGGGTPSPHASTGLDVPDGYRGIAWGTTREALLAKYPDLTPGKKDPSILVHDVTITGQPATEAFFLDGMGGLDEVDVRYVPKRTPEESATLAINMDKMFGPHEVTRADDDAYQEAWIGDTTEVRLTYDMRDATPYGPVVTYAKAAPAPSPAPGASPSATVPSGGAGPSFAAAVKDARAAGMRLTAVDAGRGKLTLVYQSAAEAREISLTADPKGRLLGAAVLTAAPQGTAVQSRAESAIDTLLAKSPPDKLTFGGPGPALAGLATLGFGKDYLSLDPKSPDALVSTSLNSPK